ncbi:MAG: hypothetical protein K6E10_05785 [Eubacterium sp.]|nr:hypothetical protein [Eubacterium sp.]
MANKIVRIIVGILIFCGIVVGAYFILPGSVKYPITQYLQSNFDTTNYNSVVNAVKASTIPGNKGITYESAMNGTCDGPSWTYEKVFTDDLGNGTYNVFVDGYKTTVTFESADSDGMITNTNAHFRVTFQVQKNGSEIKIGDKVLEAGKKAEPMKIEVANSTYLPTDDNDYFQKALDFFASHGTKE